MNEFKQKISNKIDVILVSNDCAFFTIDISQDEDLIVISDKNKAIEIANYIMRLSEKLEG